MEYEEIKPATDADTASLERAARELIVRLSDVFIATPAESINAAIRAGLRDLAHYAAARCCYVMQREDDAERFVCTHQWAEDQAMASILASWTVAASRVQWLMQRLQAERLVRVDNPASLPAAAAAERDLFEEHGIENLVAVAMEHDGDLVGGLVIQDMQGDDAGITDLLLQVGGLIASVLRRQADEQALAVSERQYQTLFEKATAPVLIIRPDDETVLDANPAAARAYGLSRDALRGQSLKAFTADVKRGERIIERILRHGMAQNVETVHRRADGTPIRLLVNSAAIRYRGERAVLCSLSDITAQKEVEEKLRMAEQRFRALLESAPDAMVIVNAAGRIVLANKQTERLFGYTRDALEDESLSLLLPERFRTTHAVHCQYFFDASRVRQMSDTDLELYGRHKDGTEFPVEILLSPIETSDGLLVTSAIRDISERKEVEQALRRSKQRWRSLVEHHPNAVFITADGVVQYANPATAALFGVDRPEALIGRSVFEFLPEDVQPTIRRRIDALEQGEPTPPLQHPLIGDDGRRRIVEVNSVPVVYHEQQAVQTVGRDVTERRRYEERLLEAKEEAERARAEAEEMNRLKSAFLANMSHEVRTPLASIIGFAEALGEEVRPERVNAPGEALEMAAEFARLIQRSGKRLLATLNSVLDLSSLEAGTMGVRVERIDVACELQETVALFRQQAEEAEVRLRLELDTTMHTAELDASALHRILSNLLSNAIKFTGPGGQITVEAHGDETHVQIVVEDTGIGIGEDFLPELFEAFKQESTGISREHEGVGLGLAVTERLVSLMNGTIDVESEKGAGTRFTVRLPREHGDKSG